MFAGSLSIRGHREVRASVTMTDNKRLAFSILHFLHDQLQSGNLSSGAQESLEGLSLHNTVFNHRDSQAESGCQNISVLRVLVQQELNINVLSQVPGIKFGFCSGESLEILLHLITL